MARRPTHPLPRYRRRNTTNRVVGRLLHTCLASPARQASPPGLAWLLFLSLRLGRHHHPTNSPASLSLALSLHLPPNHYPYNPSFPVPFYGRPSRRTFLLRPVLDDGSRHAQPLLSVCSVERRLACYSLASVARPPPPERFCPSPSQPALIADRGTLRRQTHQRPSASPSASFSQTPFNSSTSYSPSRSTISLCNTFCRLSPWLLRPNPGRELALAPQVCHRHCFFLLLVVGATAVFSAFTC